MSDIYHFAGALSRILVSSEDTDGAFSLLLNLQPPGNATPPHLHRHEAEVPLVLEGVLTIEAAGETIGLGAGDAAILPANHAHRLSNPSADATRYLLLCAPAGFERFVAEVGERGTDLDTAPKPMTVDQGGRLAEVAPGFGIVLLDASSLNRSESGRVQRASKEAISADDIVIEVLAVLGTGPRDPALLELKLPKGAILPERRHAEAAWFFVLEGRLDVSVERAWSSGEAGALLTAPGHAWHTFRNEGPEPARAILVTTAPQLQFFRNANARVGAGPPSIA